MSVFFYGCITMDGYLADKNHNLDWLHETGTTEETGYESFYDSMDITIMGRRTYDEIKGMENIADFYATTQNYVFTHEAQVLNNGFHAVKGSVIKFVEEMEKDKNIWVIGGNTILAPLLDADMVDVMMIQIAPVLLGAGIPLFSQNEIVKRFHLNEVKQYGQFAELTYNKIAKRRG